METSTWQIVIELIKNVFFQNNSSQL